MEDPELTQLLRDLDESKKLWPTISDMPAWHPSRKLFDAIEADVLAALAKPEGGE
jgi:hypothetical protein